MFVNNLFSYLVIERFVNRFDEYFPRTEKQVAWPTVKTQLKTLQNMFEFLFSQKGSAIKSSAPGQAIVCAGSGTSSKTHLWDFQGIPTRHDGDIFEGS